MVESDRAELTEAEAELYDRQIRLWGLDSQKRLRGARVLLIGLKGFGAEIAKNIILSGVKSVTFLDNQPLSKIDASAQFLAPPGAVGSNRAVASRERAQALNPMVTVSTNTTAIDDLPDSFFTNFEVVCATDSSLSDLLRIGGICHAAGVKFFCGQVWGMFGYSFADLQTHEYAEDIIQYKAPKHKADGKKTPKVESVTTTVRETINFVPLEAALSVDWREKEYSSRMRKGDPSYFVMKALLKFRTQNGRNPESERRDEDLTKLLSLRDDVAEECGVPVDFIPDVCFYNVFGEVSPACAIVGGVLGQEIIKAVSQKEPPHNNMFFYNPLKCLGLVEKYGY